MHFSCPFHDYQLKLFALTGPHQFSPTFSIYHILDFWCKIRFRIHIIIIKSNRALKKNHKKLTVEGGEVNLSGQPDRKILVFFYVFPQLFTVLTVWVSSHDKVTCLVQQQLCQPSQVLVEFILTWVACLSTTPNLLRTPSKKPQRS